MLSALRSKVPPGAGVFMEGDYETHKQLDGLCGNFSIFLELSAIDDLVGFKRAVEEEGLGLDEPNLWYGRRIGSKNMGFEERTPLMVAAMFGSEDVLSYILQTGRVDPNRACGSDGATALHCAAASGSCRSLEIVKLLVAAYADINCVDAKGNRPADLIAHCPNSFSKSRKKTLEIMLKGEDAADQASCVSNEAGEGKQPESPAARSTNGGNGTEKREYPVDPTLPDIKNGIYSTDEFRMYTFKVRPCSRAYSHDWTECPFVHPGENARRRDPRKYHYSCVPCPEFRKGSCSKGDACDYAHGIFECWLHPAQYRTRLCKDESNCTRRVCFFAHKPEDLRPVYASTGSAVPSPRSMSSIGISQFDMASLSPISLGSPSMLMSCASTPPMTPNSGSSSPMGGGAMWQNQPNMVTPPALQLQGSRLKTALNARDMGLGAELLDLEKQIRRQQLLEELAGLSSHSGYNSPYGNTGDLGMLSGGGGGLGNAKLPNLDDVLGLPQSPTGVQSHQNVNHQLRSSYSSGFSSPILRPSLPFGIDPCGSPSGSPLLNPRSAAFAMKSQSFIDRSAANRLSGLSSPAPSSPTMTPSHLSPWGSPNGKLDWGIQGEELNKLRKSTSFGIRSGVNNHPSPGAAAIENPVSGTDVPWLHLVINDAPEANPAQPGCNEEPKQRKQSCLNHGGSEMTPSWAEQFYLEQQQMVA